MGKVLYSIEHFICKGWIFMQKIIFLAFTANILLSLSCATNYLSESSTVCGGGACFTYYDDGIKIKYHSGLVLEVRNHVLKNPSVNDLIKYLKDNNSTLREDAADALGRIKCAYSVDSLIQALGDQDYGVRYAAAKALGEIGETSVEPLAKAVKYNNVIVRQWAALSLGGINDSRVAEILIQTLEDDNVSVRRAALTALGDNKNPMAMYPLIQALKDDDPGIRADAASALNSYNDPDVTDALIQALKDKDGLVRKSAASSLDSDKDDRAMDHLIEVLNDRDEDVRESAVLSLMYTKNEKAVEPLIRSLNDTDYVVRKYAAEGLGYARDARATESLIKALNDSRTEVQWEASLALGKIGDVRAVGPLIQFLDSKNKGHINFPYMFCIYYKFGSVYFQGDTDVRSAAALALGDFRDLRASDCLTRAAKDSDENVRKTAEMGLKKQNNSEDLESPLIMSIPMGMKPLDLQGMTDVVA
ncbi:MAG: HEAT repeat domain-containing protein [Methanothrix sp.]|nr:HEAT repeat domain-containing protein [Methanothrix sp.]